VPDLSTFAPVGRVREFERGLARMQPGGGVVVHGVAGSGRTTFVSALADAARSHGAAPLWIAPDESLRSVPMGALSTIVGGSAASDPPSGDEMRAAVSAIRFHGGSAPTVLVVDDAQWLDEDSASAVLTAVAARAAAVVVTTDGAEPLARPLRRLIGDGFVDLIEMAPFDRGTIADVVEHLIGGRPSDATSALLLRWSAGNPAALTAIVETGLRERCFEPADGRWWWTGPVPRGDMVAAWSSRRLAGLGDDAADALGIVALAGWIEAAILDELADAHAIVELERSHVIVARDEGDGLVVRCSAEVAAAAVVGDMAPLRRRVLARRLVDALPHPTSPAGITRHAALHLHDRCRRR
jgi:hypothetical protein